MRGRDDDADADVFNAHRDARDGRARELGHLERFDAHAGRSRVDVGFFDDFDDDFDESDLRRRGAGDEKTATKTTTGTASKR